MRRLLALLLIPALVATAGVRSLLHTHAYTDHDHPEHHHGPAAHEHHLTPAHPPSHQDDALARLEACDPGKHTVSFASLCAAPPPLPLVMVGHRADALPSPDLESGQPVRHVDVRVHGPPSRSHASPRAPPLITHA